MRMQQRGAAETDERPGTSWPAEAAPLRGLEVLLVVRVWAFYALLNVATRLLYQSRGGVPGAPPVGFEARQLVLPLHLPRRALTGGRSTARSSASDGRWPRCRARSPRPAAGPIASQHRPTTARPRR